MESRTCPICNNPAPERLRKGTIPYFQCVSCKTVFSDYLPQDGLVGGGNEIPRNTLQNPERITRFDSLFRRRDIDVLDFGAGTGYLVDDLNNAGFRAVGYDAYSPKFSKLPERGKFDLVSCVECIEHCSKPFLEVDVMHRSLRPGGVAVIETSFFDVSVEEGIKLEDFTYLSPEVGHSTLFSHHSLDLLMALKGFAPLFHFNRHVRVYQKK